jgi:hypothetical protein
MSPPPRLAMERVPFPENPARRPSLDASRYLRLLARYPERQLEPLSVACAKAFLRILRRFGLRLGSDGSHRDA